MLINNKYKLLIIIFIGYVFVLFKMVPELIPKTQKDSVFNFVLSTFPIVVGLMKFKDYVTKIDNDKLFLLLNNTFTFIEIGNDNGLDFSSKVYRNMRTSTLDFSKNIENLTLKFNSKNTFGIFDTLELEFLSVESLQSALFWICLYEIANKDNTLLTNKLKRMKEFGEAYLKGDKFKKDIDDRIYYNYDVDTHKQIFKKYNNKKYIYTIKK